MKAVVYHGPRDVRIANVPDAKIERPTDVLVKISRTNICGSDLHMYEGRTDVEKGKVLGHENLAAYSARIRGAAMVMVVDRHPDRLRLAESIGAIAIDDSKGSPVEQVMELTHGAGANRGCECVGYQAHDPQGHERRTKP